MIEEGGWGECPGPLSQPQLFRADPYIGLPTRSCYFSPLFCPLPVLLTPKLATASQERFTCYGRKHYRTADLPTADPAGDRAAGMIDRADPPKARTAGHTAESKPWAPEAVAMAAVPPQEESMAAVPP